MIGQQKISADFCVVGGGLAGMCAAVAAARNGIKTVLMHDRPMPGGNASSEVRMWVCGARGKNVRETGIVEELLLENFYRNPNAIASVWDSVMYGMVEYAPNLQLLLNCSCLDMTCDPETKAISSVTGYQGTTQSFITVEAKLFADCSGDSILAALSGADYTVGRESRDTYNESIEPETADSHTMGNSCLIQARQLDKAVKYIPPEWAKKFRSPADVPDFRGMKVEGLENFWWIETGGLGNTITDTEKNRRDLLEIAFGIWDYLKNYCPEVEKNRNWELEWVGFLPGKRESRRYIGDYVMNQNDVESGGQFDDVVAYGGWSMDDHHPAGFYHPGQPTQYHPAPSPYGITYRALYSRNIPNLFCAGRNISVSHAALSSTRVMATCGILGQACGTAAAMVIAKNSSPREIGQKYIKELQQKLLYNDCFLPGVNRIVPEFSKSAQLISNNGYDPEVLRNGKDRSDDQNSNKWLCRGGDSAEYRFTAPCTVNRMRLVLDSDLNRPEKNIVALRTVNHPELKMSPMLLRDFDISYQDEAGVWHNYCEVRDNHKRFWLWEELQLKAQAFKLTVLSSWGESPETGVFSWEIDQ